jgi:hypothetical protein
MNVCMCVSLCARACVVVCVLELCMTVYCVCVYTHTCLPVCVRTYLCVHVFCVRVCVYMCVTALSCVCVWCVCVFVCVCVRSHLQWMLQSKTAAAKPSGPACLRAALFAGGRPAVIYVCACIACVCLCVCARLCVCVFKCALSPAVLIKGSARQPLINLPIIACPEQATECQPPNFLFKGPNVRSTFV